MYTSLFDTLVADSFFSPMRTVYVVSDSQLEEIKRKQRKEELDNLEASRKRLEETYQSRIQIIDERQHELQEELKALAPAEKKTELSAEESEKCAVKA
jgi:septin family protein